MWTHNYLCYIFWIKAAIFCLCFGLFAIYYEQTPNFGGISHCQRKVLVSDTNTTESVAFLLMSLTQIIHAD